MHASTRIGILLAGLIAGGLILNAAYQVVSHEIAREIFTLA